MIQQLLLCRSIWILSLIWFFPYHHPCKSFVASTTVCHTGISSMAVIPMDERTATISRIPTVVKLNIKQMDARTLKRVTALKPPPMARKPRTASNRYANHVRSSEQENRFADLSTAGAGRSSYPTSSFDIFTRLHLLGGPRVRARPAGPAHNANAARRTSCATTAAHVSV